MMPAAAIPMVAPPIDAPPPGPATTPEAAIADPRGPLRLTDPAEADRWLVRSARHYDADRKLSHVSRAIALGLAGHLTPLEMRRWTWRRYPCD